MAKSLEEVGVYDISADGLVEILVDPDFQVEKSKAQGSIDAWVKEVSRSDDRLVFEVNTKDYARTMKGIDKNKSEVSHTTLEWNLRARTCTWSYHSLQGKMVNIHGTVRVEDQGSRARMTDVSTIEIKVPVVGGQIEKVIIKEFKKAWPTFEEVLGRWVAKTK